MPQPPTANMGLILPTDKGDADQWNFLLDTVFRTIDAHNHATGAGAKVNISQIGIDADISFIDPGGGKHAITDLKAIDFFPSPASAMTGFSGAFFVSDGSGGLVLNELYYRSIGGTNIQMTTGGTLNVSAFAGAIGGDYVGVGALEIFDDSSDAYWFQQQVGTGVRQYAKLRSADLSLFEFKAVASGPPVPVQAVTLKSPAALVSGYTLTFPGALPGTTQLLQVDNTGQIIASNSVTGTLTYGDVEPYSVAFGIVDGTAAFTLGSSAAPVFIALGVGGRANLPLRPRVGTTITDWNVRIQKTSGAGNTVTTKLWKVTSGLSGTAPTQVGVTQSNSAAAPGAINLGQSGLAEIVAANTSYFIEAVGGAAGSEFVIDYQLTTA